MKELVEFKFDTAGPPRYEQLAFFFERAIRAGKLAAGDRLPTVRQLSSSMSISATTVSSAFELLGRRGFVKAEVGRGTFVVPQGRELIQHHVLGIKGPRSPISPGRPGAKTPWRRSVLMRTGSRLRAAYPNAMECSTGRPDPALLPVTAIRKAWTDCIHEVTAGDLQYAGTEPIRSLADVLGPILEADLVPARDQDLIVGSSAQQFFALVYEVLVARSEGTNLTVAVEEPGYPTLLDTLERAGARLVGVEVDSFGAIATSLDAALGDGAQLALVTPRGHNPTGASWSRARLGELADVLTAHPRVVVVEDDQMAGIATTRPGSLLSFPELESRVLHVRSFSKSVGPDLRMAIGVARPALREPLADAKSFADGWSSRLLQRVLAKTLQDEEVYAALDHARDAYRERRQSACDAVNSVLAQHGGGAWFGPDGVNVWVHLLPGVDAKDLLERSAAAGVLVADGEPFFLAPGHSEVVRLNAGAVKTEDAGKAGKILAQSILATGCRKPEPIHV